MRTPADMVKFTKQSENDYLIVFENGICLGHLLKEVDGYFVYYPETRGGFMESWIMRIIADKMDDLNRDWDETARREIGGQS
jgi:hypothetical protein